MKRRDFITANMSSIDQQSTIEVKNDKPRVLSGLDKYTTPLDRPKVIHLLRRLSFAPEPDLINTLTGKTAADAVAIILGTGTETAPIPPTTDWVTTPEENPLEQIVDIKAQIESKINGRFVQFIGWWLELMRVDTIPAREKLTLFLTTIWTIDFNYDTLALIPTPLLYANNQTLRKDRLGNYKQIAEDITLDGAMNLFQSIFYSTGTKPNENYQRELMELFTMGIGNYTEGDIKEGSRALTGWRTAPYFGQPGPKGYFNTYFSPNDHDITAKTYMGTTIPARDQLSNTEDQVLNGEIRVLLNTMFTQRADAICQFVCRKIYRYFVYSNPAGDDSGVISALATIMKNGNFELRPVFEALFTSQHFFDSANIGVQIKTPPEFIITLERQLGITYSNSYQAIFDLEQKLYNPPNVSGWKAYRTWISTRTYPLRIKYANDLLSQVTDQQLVTLAAKFTGYTTASTLVSSFAEYLLPKTIDQTRSDRYKVNLLTGANCAESDWGTVITSGGKPAANGLRALISTIFKSPDFQLC